MTYICLRQNCTNSINFESDKQNCFWKTMWRFGVCNVVVKKINTIIHIDIVYRYIEFIYSPRSLYPCSLSACWRVLYRFWKYPLFVDHAKNACLFWEQWHFGDKGQSIEYSWFLAIFSHWIISTGTGWY